MAWRNPTRCPTYTLPARLLHALHFTCAYIYTHLFLSRSACAATRCLRRCFSPSHHFHHLLHTSRTYSHTYRGFHHTHTHRHTLRSTTFWVEPVDRCLRTFGNTPCAAFVTLHLPCSRAGCPDSARYVPALTSMPVSGRWVYHAHRCALPDALQPHAHAPHYRAHTPTTALPRTPRPFAPTPHPHHAHAPSHTHATPRPAVIIGVSSA